MELWRAARSTERPEARPSHCHRNRSTIFWRSPDLFPPGWPARMHSSGADRCARRLSRAVLLAMRFAVRAAACRCDPECSVRPARTQEPQPRTRVLFPLTGRSHPGRNIPRKSQAIRAIAIPATFRSPTWQFRRLPVKKARKTALSSTYLWQRPSHKHLFTLRNRLSAALMAALTGCSAACEFAVLGVTSRNAVRTGGVFLNGGIGGGRRTSGHCSLRQCAARSWLHVRARTVIRLSLTRSC